MWKIAQIQSQLKQAFFFRPAFSLKTWLSHVAMLPLWYVLPGARAQYPLAINFLITARCNLRCSICHYEKMLSADGEQELSVKDMERFLAREKKHDFHVFFGGGEPFMRDDLLDLVRLVKSYKRSCGICTNGLLLDNDKAQALAATSLDYIMFSVYGPDQVHEGVTDVSGAYKTVTHNIASFIKYRNKTRVIINCPINATNLAFLPDMVAIAKTLGVDALRIEHLNYLTHKEIQEQEIIAAKSFPDAAMDISSHNSESISIDIPELHKRLQEVQHLGKKAGLPVYIKPYLAGDELQGWYDPHFSLKRSCFFVWQSLFIDPQGYIVPCHYLNMRMGTIKEQSIEEIWNSRTYRTLRKELRKGLMPACARCCKL